MKEGERERERAHLSVGSLFGVGSGQNHDSGDPSGSPMTLPATPKYWLLFFHEIFM